MSLQSLAALRSAIKLGTFPSDELEQAAVRIVEELDKELTAEDYDEGELVVDAAVALDTIIDDVNREMAEEDEIEDDEEEDEV